MNDQFQVFVNVILPYIFTINFLVAYVAGILWVSEYFDKISLIKFYPKVNSRWVLALVGVNVVTQLVVFPCTDLGANCWYNCFGLTHLGIIGYAANYITVLVIVAIATQYLSRPWIIPLTVIYGISALLQLAFLDKGLWCICRSSGFIYLWFSFEILILTQFAVYFTTLFVLYSYGMKKE